MILALVALQRPESFFPGFDGNACAPITTLGRDFNRRNVGTKLIGKNIVWSG